MIKMFKSYSALVGVHVCSTPDWSNLARLELDFFHFDATLPQLKTDLNSFLELRKMLDRKILVVWGIIPTASASDFEVRDFSPQLFELWERMAGRKSIPEITAQSLLAPACGLGTLNPRQAYIVRESLIRTRQRLLTVTICKS
jgi:hypothetical protein